VAQLVDLHGVHHRGVVGRVGRRVTGPELVAGAALQLLEPLDDLGAAIDHLDHRRQVAGRLAVAEPVDHLGDVPARLGQLPGALADQDLQRRVGWRGRPAHRPAGPARHQAQLLQPVQCRAHGSGQAAVDCQAIQLIERHRRAADELLVEILFRPGQAEHAEHCRIMARFGVQFTPLS
jgi:hypothetical protein